jgi:hemerythrin
MGQIDWNPEWDTGFPMIDEQHRRLIAEFNDFLDAVKRDFHGEHVENLIEFLIDFLDAHCEEEEFRMRATKYPRLVEHMAFHEHLRTTAKTLADRSDKAPEVFEAEVIAFVLDWIEHHIKVEDTLMAKHLIKFAQQGSEARL